MKIETPNDGVPQTFVVIGSSSLVSLASTI